MITFFVRHPGFGCQEIRGHNGVRWYFEFYCQPNADWGMECLPVFGILPRHADSHSKRYFAGARRRQCQCVALAPDSVTGNPWRRPSSRSRTSRRSSSSSFASSSSSPNSEYGPIIYHPVHVRLMSGDVHTFESAGLNARKLTTSVISNA